ncbi:hypothetical protein FA13DRAFT_308110 [Coprinellus micaceus]|uniref:Uncharacterized protein n=1 Tax=Coprinellus micaceus TaxID=71717 RepID=A0A4Y7TDZ7_COPMI|nr:hypothetical protein FA13DRAFT_308110 [Coprinellus micaceus]
MHGNSFAPLNEIPGTSDERIRNLLEEWPPPVPRAGSIWSRSHHILSTVRFVEECQAIIALGNGEQALRDLGQQWSSKTNQRIDEHVACHRFLEYRKEVDEELMKPLESQTSARLVALGFSQDECAELCQKSKLQNCPIKWKQIQDKFRRAFEAGPSVLTDCEWEQVERDLLIPLMGDERASRIWAARLGMCRSVSYYASLFYFAHRIASLPYSQLCTWLLSYF